MLKQVYAGIDLGGTKILTVIVDEEGRVLASEERPTEASRGHEAIIATMADMVNVLVGGNYSLAGAGVATAGTLDPDTGTVEFASNLGWTNVPLGSELERLLGVKVTVDNDANAAAVGEWKAGAGIGSRNCVFITVSTGIGSGVICDGKLMRGRNASAAELGHITIDWQGAKCLCGNVGCLELYASGTAIGRSAREAAAADPARGGKLIELAGGDAEKINSRHVSEAAKQGDGLALEVLRRAGRALGAGMVSAIHIANPEVIILGGGASHIGEPLLEPMREYLEAHAIEPMRRGVKFAAPKLGAQAGAVGAALMLRP
ncbi:ROK family protein [Cohnella sp. AR92]|uniref:ROK family protein n=1 Tax=Cohnella sp. AR92 TaxID=648716 RepID=UPI000F8C6521|nr:ROK family protein [Cohnella sp. AR92]RUS46634.1 ROK family protein [Cohnella sp. AR92]